MVGEGEVLARLTLAAPAIVRLACAADLPALEWFGEFAPQREIIAQAWRMQADGQGAMLVADVNGFPAGQAWIDYARRRRQGRAVVWAVRVFAPLRGCGLGSALMLAAEAAAAARGVRTMELAVDRDNAGVLAFYERLGYRGCGTEQGQYRYRTPDGDHVTVPVDQWLLRKELAAAPSRRAP